MASPSIDRTIGNSSTSASALSDLFCTGSMVAFLRMRSVRGPWRSLLCSGRQHRAAGVAADEQRNNSCRWQCEYHFSHRRSCRRKSITKTGPGTLTLSTNNSFTGKVIVNGVPWPLQTKTGSGIILLLWRTLHDFSPVTFVTSATDG